MLLAVPVSILAGFPHLTLAQQNEELIDLSEDQLMRQEDAGYAEELYEEQLDLLSFPINLNTANMAQLESSGLFTPFQAQSLIRYRETYGNLLSIYELASIQGCGRLEVQNIYMTVDETFPSPQQKGPRGYVLLFAGRAYANSANQVVYPGSLWKSSLRLKKGLGKRLSVGLAYEKDPGEQAFWGYRPEHLCGYIHWKGKGSLEQLIIGTFKINNGMGLIHGSNLMNSPAGIQSRPLLLSTLKSYAGTAESLLQQGASCSLNLGTLKLLIWASFQGIDLSLDGLAENTQSPDWSAFMRKNAYHRSSSEQLGRNLAYLGSAGIQLTVSLNRLNLGLQYAPEFSSLTPRGRDSLQVYQGYRLYHASSMQWHWRSPRTELYGEFAPGTGHSSAFLAGSRFFLNDFLSGTLQLHSYGADHRETFASAYASGSHIKNERGVLLLIHAEPFRAIRSDFALELFESPAPRTLVIVPSSGFRFMLTLKNGNHEPIHWRFRLVKTLRQITPASEVQAGIRPLAHIDNNRMDGRVVYKPFSGFTWQNRLVFSYSPGERSKRGHAILQQLTVRVKNRLRCTAQLVMYNIPSWDNRIYLYEPGLYQQFSFPVYSGTGHKISALISFHPSESIVFETKGTIVCESDEKKWELAMQIRVKL